MAQIHVEKLGGLAGFGGIGARIRSVGQLDTSALSAADQQAVDALFQSAGKSTPSQTRDGFRYKLTRVVGQKSETIEVAEAHIPAALAQCVKDELV